jgi:hypothetical protein
MSRRILRGFWALAIAVSLGGYTAELTPGRRSALDHISAQSLRGHISFLASDLLEGRDTPSRGLDIAADYIASEFRRAGLKPAGEDGYFQTGRLLYSEHSAEGASISFDSGDSHVRLGPADLRAIWIDKLEYLDVAPVKVVTGAPIQDSIEGKVVVVALERTNGAGAAIQALAKWKPAAAVMVQKAAVGGPELHTRLEEPGHEPAFTVLRVSSTELYELIEAARPGQMDAKLSLRMRARTERLVELKNVAGILPGSDPALAGSYVLVTAHYDHLGRKKEGEGDLIYNGANDDASGVASEIEIAQALSAPGAAPRRSILFIAYYGEEEGLFGSRYYASHPLVPLAKTVADVNLEQLGRTDGDQPAGTITMTGFGYSDITTALEMAGAVTGMKIQDPGKNGDAYFNRSDNQSLADRGVPSHTFAAAFDFPDYHQVGDEWQKIDYPNLEKVDRTMALMILMVADSPEPPRWNESNAKTDRYVKAQRELQ